VERGERAGGQFLRGPDAKALLSGPKAPDAKALAEREPVAVKRMRDVDRENAARLKEVLARHGWPGRSPVGRDGAHAAWALREALKLAD
jgi:hypothetical protein